MSTPSKAGSSASDPTKDKSPKVKTPFGKKDKSKDKGGCGSGGSGFSGAKLSGDNASLLSNGSTGAGSTVGGGVGGAGAGGGASGSSGGVGGICNGLDSLFPQVSMEPRVAVEAVSVRREVARPVLDPYEFNAKVEDGIGLPPKKLKTESKVYTRCA
nr:hypothetical protein BaRGS_033726 [Batillaria attramentaria]